MKLWRSRTTPAPNRPDALVVFRCSEQQAAEIDVAVGPCVPRIGPRGGRLRPIASPFSQWGPESFDHLRALYAMATGKPETEAIANQRVAGAGTIASLTEQFVTALAGLVETTADPDTAIDACRRIAERWLVAVPWPAPMQVGGLTSRIVAWAGECRLAREKGLGVYCWRGPEVPTFAIAHGVGPESYEAYRQARKRK